ncbi:hypothetical protein ABE25_06350 [Cytobacillus firmus]|nr:hypothetical protein [Cytobacillus firmus]MBG9601808.1 hypothetical protein [Cytobacillus firmus]
MIHLLQRPDAFREAIFPIHTSRFDGIQHQVYISFHCYYIQLRIHIFRLGQKKQGFRQIFFGLSACSRKMQLKSCFANTKNCNPAHPDVVFFQFMSKKDGHH